MMLTNLASLGLIAALLPLSSPSPGPTQPLKTIGTVKSSAYCTSLVLHFNLVAQIMIANDRTLDRVDEKLIDLNGLFKNPDYVKRFVDTRTKLMGYVKQISDSLPALQDEINKLRAGEHLTTNAKEAADMHALAEKAQLAYNKQHALATDLLGIVQGMMDYDIQAGDHPIGGEDLSTLRQPADMKDVKSYLRFDGQRDVIADAESKAGDQALDIATTHCR
jgi:hypothetical protein